MFYKGVFWSNHVTIIQDSRKYGDNQQHKTTHSQMTANCDPQKLIARICHNENFENVIAQSQNVTLMWLI